MNPLFENIDAPVTVVLHHPFFFTKDYWTGWSDKLNANIIAYDAPYHGDNHEGTSLQKFAQDSINHAATLTDTRLYVAGVSQGGVIAQESAFHPQVEGVIGISTTRTGAGPEEHEAMNATLDAWGDNYPPEELSEAIAANASNAKEPACTLTREAISKNRGENVAQGTNLLLNRRSGINLVKPTIFIHGSDDRTYPVVDVDGCETVVLDGVSHSSPIEAADDVAGAIKKFIEHEQA